MNYLTLHFKLFNDKVKLLNQLGQKNLILTADEARNLHSDLFDLLNRLAASSSTDNIIKTDLDGGKF
jgi:hypothetical protein